MMEEHSARTIDKSDHIHDIQTPSLPFLEEASIRKSRRTFALSHWTPRWIGTICIIAPGKVQSKNIQTGSFAFDILDPNI
mmetsp:Transcript_56575/g.104720  ORF Transcript_56575/g.104720 Transcript_56575/m.104720 type:complete len:80 (+) Transcript_56575:223-462(+)